MSESGGRSWKLNEINDAAAASQKLLNSQLPPRLRRHWRRSRSVPRIGALVWPFGTVLVIVIVIIIVVITVLIFMRVRQLGITRFHSDFGLICCGMREIAKESINMLNVYRVYTVHIRVHTYVCCINAQ